jgi:hypothetical protein
VSMFCRQTLVVIFALVATTGSAFAEAPLVDAGVVGEPASAAAEFRNQFYNLVRSRYSRPEFDSLVFKPTSEVNAATGFSRVEFDGDLSFPNLRRQFAGIKPSSLYQAGREQPLYPIADPRLSLERHGVTFISFPGVFVEFSASRPFEDVLARERSTAARDFALRLEGCQLEECYDEVYSMHGLGRRRVRLDEVVHVASYDREDGTPLYRVVYVAPPRGSLESMGTIEEHAPDHLRRIDKYLRLTGDSNSLHLIGYSRGASATLEFLVQGRARVQQYPWAESIKTVNFLGGALNGARFADGFLESSEGMPGLVNALIEVSGRLEPRPGGGIWAEQMAIMRNSYMWGEVTRRAIDFLRPQGASIEDPAVASEHLPGNSTALRSLFGMGRGILFELFDLQHPLMIGDYWGNIARFRHAGVEFRETVQSLTTESRIRWYQNHVLPADVVYNTLLSTMYDRTSEVGHVDPMVKNPVAYNYNSADFGTNRRSYYGLAGLTGEDINDGAVTASEGFLSSRILQNLNPNQRAIRAPLLGVFGSHHWGSVMPRSLGNALTSDVNPFPRDLVLLALATWVAESR